MERTSFEAQIKRLESQWPSSYGQERKAILWQAFRGAHEIIFHDAISDCLAHMRSAPLLDELEKAVEKSKVRESQSNQSDRSAFQILKDSAKYTKADAGLVKMCLEHLRLFTEKKITEDEFYTGCDALNSMADKILSSDKLNTEGARA